jgi:hypothetical protein
MMQAISFPALLGVLLLACWLVPASLRIRDVVSHAAGFSSTAIFEGDVWWHLATGERILSTHKWPTTDPFSFTAGGNDWIAFEWLGDLTLAVAKRWGGMRGLTVLFAGVSSAIMLLIWYCAYLRSSNSKAAFAAVMLVLPLAILPLTLRPQLFGYLFLMLILAWLERFRQGRQKALWMLPVLFLAWVNVHGSFMVGLAVLGAYWAGGLIEMRAGGLEAYRWTPKQRKHLALVSLVSMLVLPLTPYGTRVAGNPLAVALLQPHVAADVQEWQPLTFTEPYGKYLVFLLLLFLLAVVLARPTFRVEEFGLLLCASFLTFAHVRFVLFLAPILALVLSSMLTRWVPGYEPAKDKYILNGVLIAVVSLTLIRTFPSKHDVDILVEHQFPKLAVEYLQQHPEIAGPTFNDDRWGGYIMSTLGPSRKVFIDGRFDLYDYAGVITDYGEIITASPRTEFLLDKYGVRACLIQRDSVLAKSLAGSPGWHRIYEDDLSTIIVRATESRARNSFAKSAFEAGIGSRNRPGTGGMFRRQFP